MTTTLAPKFWRFVASWARLEIVALLAMILIALAVRLL